MVSKNCLVTAGHLLISADPDFRGEAAQSIDIYFGVYKSDGQIKYTYHKTVTPDTTLFYSDTKYTGKDDESEYDYGFIKFNSDLEWNVGSWVLRAEITSNLVGTGITVTGYETGIMKTHSGNIMSLYGNHGTNALFRHSVDTSGGQSGSPIYTSDNKVVGIHIKGFASPNIYNSAWRITADFLYLLRDNGCITLA